MSEKLKDFLISRKEEEAKNLSESWEEKRKLVESILIECLESFNAAFDIGKGVPYKEGLEKYTGCFEIKNIKGFPLATKVDSEGLLFNPLHDGQPPIDFYLDDDTQIKYFKLLLSLEYTPPDFIETIHSLQFLLFYYTSLVHNMPLEITSRIDLVTAQLTRHATKELFRIEKGGFTIDRIHSSREGRKPSIERMKKLVLEEYESLLEHTDPIILEGMSRNKIATLIKKKLGISSPRKNDTIIKYIEESYEKKGQPPPWKKGLSKM